jgi:cytochrome c peroxidase
MLKLFVGGLALAAAVGCAADTSTDDQAVGHDNSGSIPNNLPQADSAGAASTVTVNASKLDLTGPFFQSLGTNGRSCGTCHSPTDGWTVIPAHIQQRFDATGGTDPIFRTVDGSVSPVADVSTVDARRKAYAMLLTKGLIRVGIGVPNGADFHLAAVDDPYHHANAADISLFRRPLPSANLDKLSTVMWVGRVTFASANSFAPAADDNCLKAPFVPADGSAPKCFRSIDFDLADQANGATLGHAQATTGLTPPVDRAITDFEEGLYFGQLKVNGIGNLDNQGATGGAENIAGETTYFGINDNFGDYQTGAPFTAKIFDLYDAWDGSATAQLAQVARGQKLFNSRQFTISGVGGLNGSVGLPASFSGTCGTCHNGPNAGNHSIPAPLDIGIADASRRTADMPLYTFCSNADPTNCRETTDPGRALITGHFADMARFKGPTLRGVAARAPYFHNGSAKDLGAVVDFYNDRFNAHFTAQERADLVAFLQTL